MKMDTFLHESGKKAQGETYKGAVENKLRNQCVAILYVCKAELLQFL